MSGLEYMVLESRGYNGASDLASLVTAKIAKGWRPQGGVSVAITENFNYGLSYCQAMVRGEASAGPQGAA
jgi:hypothetical protein